MGSRTEKGRPRRARLGTPLTTRSVLVDQNRELSESPSADPATVEGEVRARLAAELGGLRGSLETAFPIVVFTVAYVLSDQLRLSLGVALAAGVMAYGLRRLQGSQTRFVAHGLVGMLVAAAFAAFTGQAEAAFLPGMIQNGVWAVALAGSIAVRRPLAGFLIGAVLDDPTGWRDDPAIVRLSDRLTLILLAPMVVRLAVQIPLYLAGEVGWLGTARVVLGWPLHAATLGLAGLVLLRGRTPLRSDGPRQPPSADG